MRFLIFVAHAGLAIAATAPGCHFWVREISTGQNVGQGCVGKGWTTYPWAAKARVGVTADQSCNLKTESTTYAAQFDGECIATVQGK
ncbi:hypothetical protein CABS01_10831 [Colletotrichum abscissum]|uniref:Secreted protein n=2 Tax=Colletotrichum acutatum species complex TaxID=2707335 RepID=A0A9P9XN60_9PEZI|nr:uncharacterized protein CTAM01_16209 [Colletotrichum tamarilloi]XP_060398910.1 uncharacterized protein CABS01_10831 [Colletotrichum abscissum]KAI3557321.1 hypothetical protein CABS02_02425 [Colletotrichum abscissum]KAK1473128.1 hypothetical protein CTAM01_16209 [Colletotrichum tamarilloi]KAK1497853.1 hypothetical protein CABS01_10831 [Colletotrichum abscissum]